MAEQQCPVRGQSLSLQEFEEVLERRLVLGQAQGILMERLGLTAERAFAYLSRASQQTNTKIEVVAARLVETRLLPRLNARPAGVCGEPDAGELG